jgi:hypothetical protein
MLLYYSSIKLRGEEPLINQGKPPTLNSSVRANVKAVKEQWK